MIKTPTIETGKQTVVEQVLTAAQKLSAHEKLVVARKLLDEATEESLLPHFEPGTVIELYSPIEVEGITDEMIKRFESLSKPDIT